MVFSPMDQLWCITIHVLFLCFGNGGGGRGFVAWFWFRVLQNCSNDTNEKRRLATQNTSTSGYTLNSLNIVCAIIRTNHSNDQCGSSQLRALTRQNTCNSELKPLSVALSLSLPVSVYISIYIYICIYRICCFQINLLPFAFKTLSATVKVFKVALTDLKETLEVVKATENIKHSELPYFILIWMVA